MIRVTVELVSAIDPSRSKVLGVAIINNNGIESVTTAGRNGTYTATFSKWAPKINQVWKRASIESFDRRTRGAWDMLYLLLHNAVGYRNPVK